MKWQIRLALKATVTVLILLGFCTGNTHLGAAMPQAVHPVELGVDQRQKLEEYAEATVRYFTSPQANNLEVGFTHAFFGTGKFRVFKNGTWQEEAWDLTRGYGSHVNINEVTLRFLSLAAAYKMGWLGDVPGSEQYEKSWGQILIGLQTLRAMQTSGDPNQFYEGHFHRSYLTTIERNGVHDLNRAVTEIVRPPSEDIQSSDDNALPFINLLILEGLANDLPGGDPNRSEIIDLCRGIRSAIDLRGFINNANEIAHNYTNGSLSTGTWDRLSTEGPIILASMLLSDQITLDQFYEIAASLENKPASCSICGGEPISIGKPSYHAALFMHGLRAIHGMPVTARKYPRANYYATSTLPVSRAHLAYAECHGFKALGSQVMTQQFEGTPIFELGGVQGRFPGNEDCVEPIPGVSLVCATGPHAWFIPLLRWSYLKQSEIDMLFDWMADYETDFFHSGSDEQLGWEAAIPWTPDDTTCTWVASDGTVKYTDWGRPYEALNTAYIVLSIFDALNPEAPLASYNVIEDQVRDIAAYFDSGTPLVSTTQTIEPGLDFSPQRQITYTVALQSHVGNVSGVSFTDTLPPGTVFNAWIERPIGADVSDGDPQEITWTGSISAGEAITFTFVASHTGNVCEKYAIQQYSTVRGGSIVIRCPTLYALGRPR